MELCCSISNTLLSLSSYYAHHCPSNLLKSAFDLWVCHCQNSFQSYPLPLGKNSRSLLGAASLHTLFTLIAHSSLVHNTHTKASQGPLPNSLPFLFWDLPQVLSFELSCTPLGCTKYSSSEVCHIISVISMVCFLLSTGAPWQEERSKSCIFFNLVLSRSLINIAELTPDMISTTQYFNTDVSPLNGTGESGRS